MAFSSSVWFALQFGHRKTKGPKFLDLSCDPVHGFELLRVASHTIVLGIREFLVCNRFFTGNELQFFFEFDDRFLGPIGLHATRGSPHTIFFVWRGEGKDTVGVSFILADVHTESRPRRAAPDGVGQTH